MKIPFLRLAKHHEKILPELIEATTSVIRTGQFILGPTVEEFEKKFAQYHETSFAIGLNSGTDAIILSLKALGISSGDEVITTSNSFITTVSSIELVGARPILVDIGADDNIDVNLIESKINPKTKAIIPVHWGGRPCEMDKIVALSKKYNLFIIEDCAQAISARYKGKLVGTFGDCGAFSLHPFKTLGACGDAGIVLTKDPKIADSIRILRNNGLNIQGVSSVWSNNSRLDALQAAILSVKMNYFEEWTNKRISLSNQYFKNLSILNEVILPEVNNEIFYSVFHTYIIKAQNRDELQQFLKDNGIETRLHYNIPIHQQPVMKIKHKLPQQDLIAKHILSLPLNAELEELEVEYICEKITEFYTKKRAFQNTADLLLQSQS